MLQVNIVIMSFAPFSSTNNMVNDNISNYQFDINNTRSCKAPLSRPRPSQQLDDNDYFTNNMHQINRSKDHVIKMPMYGIQSYGNARSISDSNSNMEIPIYKPKTNNNINCRKQENNNQENMIFRNVQRTSKPLKYVSMNMNDSHATRLGKKTDNNYGTYEMSNYMDDNLYMENINSNHVSISRHVNTQKNTINLNKYSDEQLKELIYDGRLYVDGISNNPLNIIAAVRNGRHNDKIVFIQKNNTSKFDVANQHWPMHAGYETKSDNKKGFNTTMYQSIPFMGSGKGSGNIELETDILYGTSTRVPKQSGLGTVSVNRFENLFWDPQDPNHIVADLPRGGVDTRNDKETNDGFINNRQRR
jgi:hypothetical protein